MMFFGPLDPDRYLQYSYGTCKVFKAYTYNKLTCIYVYCMCVCVCVCVCLCVCVCVCVCLLCVCVLQPQEDDEVLQSKRRV